MPSDINYNIKKQVFGVTDDAGITTFTTVIVENIDVEKKLLNTDTIESPLKEDV